MTTPTMQQVLLTLQAPTSQGQRLLAAFRGVPALTRVDHGFDTAEGALASLGISLRLRQESRGWTQTMALNLGGQWVEHLVFLGASVKPHAPDIGRHRGATVYAGLDVAVAQALEQACENGLQEQFRLKLEQRSRRRRLKGGTTIALTQQVGVLDSGVARVSVCSLELELVDGPSAPLFVEAMRWQSRHGLWLDVDPVSTARGVRLALEPRSVKAVQASIPEVDAKTPADLFARKIIACCLDQVLGNASVVAGGAHGAEHVHQMRVGLRRLRIAIDELAELNAGIDTGWGAVLSEVFQRLGESRDIAMLAALSRDELGPAGAPALPAIELPSDEEVTAVARGAEFQSVLIAIRRFTTGAAEGEGCAFEGSVREAIAPRLDRLHRVVRKRAQDFLALSPVQQHELRKSLKRLRYLAEFVAPLFRKRARSGYFDALTPAQDALGRLNDRSVALAAYEARPESEAAGKWFAIGWLVSQQRMAQADAASALVMAGKAKRFWR
ncbi:MAG: CHAD domain-containing protein [Paucibacter sp.]|nr:CHAD domain-containing protein [Roseateles sp.]